MDWLGHVQLYEIYVTLLHDKMYHDFWFACWETSAKTISGRLHRGHPGETTKTQQTKSVDIISEYLLRTNGQLFEMNVKIVSSYLQAGKAFDPLQHDQ